MLTLRDHYTASAFASLVERETDSLELKTGAGTKPLQDAMVAFSNTDGGIIFIGVTDGRQVQGRRLDQGTADQVHSAARTAHDLGRYSIREIDVDGKPVTAVSVQRRRQGFSSTSDGRVLVRRGGSKDALVGQQLWEFLSTRALTRFEQAHSGLKLAAADKNAIGDLKKACGWPRSNAGLPDRLRERGLMDADDNLTIAGALCLTDPASSLGTGKFIVEVMRYPDDSTRSYDRREIFTGPVYKQVSEAASFISAELGTDQVVTGLYRHDVPRLPPRVVREAIANAVAHRSYELDRTTIQVEMRPSFVLVRSPGRLVEPVTVETMRHSQAARNAYVLATLRTFNLAEDNGQGVDLMEDQMREALLDDPQFDEQANSVTVRLSILGPIAPRERAWLSELERGGALKPADRLSLILAARGEVLTNSLVRDNTGLDRLEARRSLRRLTDAGLLLQHGERGGATYTLAKPFAPPAAYRMNPKQLEELVLDAAAKGELQNSRVRELTGLDRAEARALLVRLVERGDLIQEGVTRSTVYRLARP